MDKVPRVMESGSDITQEKAGTSTNIDLVAAEIELISMEKREFNLKKLLQTVSNRFDYILIIHTHG